jgi:hypothetical protein
MDGNAQFEREAATDELDKILRLQTLYGHPGSGVGAEPMPTIRGSQSGSDPRLNETRAMPAAP